MDPDKIPQLIVCISILYFATMAFAAYGMYKDLRDGGPADWLVDRLRVGWLGRRILCWTLIVIWPLYLLVVIVLAIVYAIILWIPAAVRDLARAINDD